MPAIIPLDILRYHIIPYLHVSAAVVSAASAATAVSILDRVQYTQPHGTKITYYSRTLKFCNGKLHCADGPADVDRNATKKEWWYHGKRHRVDGPAVECNDGSYQWYLHGKKHRDRRDGPATCCKLRTQSSGIYLTPGDYSTRVIVQDWEHGCNLSSHSLDDDIWSPI